MTTARGPSGDARLGRLGSFLTKDNAAVGLVIDTRYEVHRRIARGGMGEVFYAIDRRLDRPVAMKILAHGLSEGRWKARFEVEARTMSRIEHPGIVPIYDIGTLPDGRMYYTMKYVQGRTLEEFIHEKGPMGPLLEALRGACAVVQQAHERGVIHRDLKPANIMIGEKGQVFVLDWGIARVMEEMRKAFGEGTVAAAPGVTAFGAVLGTVEYMPPEQARGDLTAIDERSDVYAFGAILYEILTGRPPVMGTSVTHMIEAAAASAIVPPRERNPQVSPDLEAVCLKALSADPHDRYASVQALSRDLENFTEGRSVVAKPESLPRRTWRSIQRHPVLASLAAAVLLLGTAIPVILLPLYRDLERAREEQRTESQALTVLESARPVLDRAWRARYRSEPFPAELMAEVVETRKNLEEAIARAPRLPVAHLLLGRAWEILGWSDRAETCWREALQRDPGLGAARFHLSRSLVMRAYLLRIGLDTEDVKRKQPEAVRVAEEAQRVTEEAAKCESGFDDELQREFVAAVLDHLREDFSSLRRRVSDALKRYPAHEGIEGFHWLASAGLTGEEQQLELDRALALCPNDPLLLFSRAGVRFGSGDLRRGIEDCDRIVRVAPRFTDAWVSRGVAYKRLGKREEALRDFESALEVDPFHVGARILRGEILRKRGDLDRAAEDYQEALRKDPGNPSALLGQALLRKQRGDRKGAEEGIEALLKDGNPRFVPAIYQRGLLRFEAGDGTGALRDFDEVLDLDPRYSDAWSARATALLSVGEWSRAIPDLNHALKLNPEDSTAWSNRGLARFQLGDLKGAEEDYTQALKFVPADATVWANRAAVRLALEDPEGAEKDSTEAVRFRPDFARAYDLRGRARVLQEDAAGGLEDFDEAIRLKSDDLEYYVDRAGAHRALGQLDEALADYDEVLRIQPGDLVARTNRGNVHHQKGDLAPAIADYREVLKRAPQSWPYRAKIESLLQSALRDSEGKKE